MNQMQSTGQNATLQPAAPRGMAIQRHRLAAPASRFWWQVPLGWQLGLLYTLLLVATLGVVGSVVYSQQESFLVQDAAGRLAKEATRIVALPVPPSSTDGKQPGPDGHPDQQSPGDLHGDTYQNHVVENLVRGLSGQGVTVAILDTQGNVITTTQALEGEAAPTVVPVTTVQVTQALTSGQSVQWITARSDGSRQVNVLTSITGSQPSSAVTARDQDPMLTLLVEQSASLAGADAALERLKTYLLLGVLGGTLAGILLVLAFTRAVLRPLDRVVATADAVASGDLQRRSQLPAGKNEVARLGKAFDYMVSRLVNTLDAQRRFVADASHELRTPLTSLKGLAEILVIGAHGNDTQVIEQSAQAVNGELERMIRLVNDLLTLSRLDSTGGSGAPTSRRARMNVTATVSAAVNQMAPLAEMRDVMLQQEGTEPLYMIADSGQIKQVLLNLVDNALRHTPAGGQVTVRETSEGKWARIDVQDTGSGINPKDLPHIFERFYRGDSSRTRATGNSGLGLAIAQGIIEAHDGTLEVSSVPGQGTCFTIRLPLAGDHLIQRAAATH